MNLMRNSDRMIKVDKKSLTETIAKNKAIHEAAYFEALEDYKTAVIKKCSQIVAQAQTDVTKVGNYLNLSIPSSYVKTYADYLEMLKWEVEDVVELSGIEFQHLVRDEWEWKDTFMSTMASNKAYLSVT